MAAFPSAVYCFVQNSWQADRQLFLLSRAEFCCRYDVRWNTMKPCAGTTHSKRPSEAERVAPPFPQLYPLYSAASLLKISRHCPPGILESLKTYPGLSKGRLFRLDTTRNSPSALQRRKTSN